MWFTYVSSTSSTPSSYSSSRPMSLTRSSPTSFITIISCFIFGFKKTNMLNEVHLRNLCWLSHSCKVPADSPMSVPMRIKAFPILMSLKPWLLSSAINVLAVNAVKPLGLTYMVQMNLLSVANASHRSDDASWKEVTKRLHTWASISVGSAVQSVCSFQGTMLD